MTNFDFNDAGKQKSFDLIPNIVAPVQLNILPGGVGDGGWLTRAQDGKSVQSTVNV